MRIGYGRVSAHDQHPEAQHDALRAAGCEHMFLDVASGKLANRPELTKALLSANREGDQLVVTKLDRLGRSLANLIDLAAARARGRTGGQKPKLGPRQVKLARQMHEEIGSDRKRAHTVRQIADEFGVTRPTIYRHLARD
jgi:DNA invertase Pin-like site-specific DNA recombinase